jgi:hypothetical protein
MERMNFIPEYDSQLWKVLDNQGLADPSQYHKPGFFDEVPLYSRFADVLFLRKLHNKDAADSVLLDFALRFLSSVVSIGQSSHPFFAAITIWTNPYDEFIVPNLFVCCGDFSRLIGHLFLHEVKTSGSKKVQKLLSKVPVGPLFLAFEDSSTVPEMPRVMIIPRAQEMALFAFGAMMRSSSHAAGRRSSSARKRKGSGTLEEVPELSTAQPPTPTSGPV